MNLIGRKIYYDETLGNVLIETGEHINGVLPSTIEQDIANFKALSERNRETFDVLELPYGAYAQDFAEGRLIGVDVETKIPIFEYPNPENPEEPIVPPAPLSVEVEQLKARQDFTEGALLDLLLRR